MRNQSETRDGSAKSIFLDALEIASAGDRMAYLDRRCGTNPTLRAEVEALLLHHGRLEGYLERPALDPDSTNDGARRPLTEGPGTVIGPYKLLERIGEGGMGQVYMAEQTRPVRRRVALKIIKPGMDTRQVVARFEAERQALALMDHPNIAKVLDAGATDSGRPYFVMELVRGVPITDYCDQAHLPIPERLGLFVQVCQAVQHAHQKGVIHRDLKPSNILVTLHDGVPVPKVIDFGIAKATGQQLTDKTLFTGFAQLVGTPLYMSPEQAEMSGLDVDTRSDVYSLGVLLYELLTGTTPFDRESICEAAFDEMRRIIREDEPPTPSTRLGALGPTLTTVSTNRGTDPRHLSRAVHGELDWVVMKALEKDRARRYETASGFAADVLRYLSDRPVEACPPSARYRFRKFARRNRAALMTAALVGSALVAGTAVSTWQAIRASKAERTTAAALKAVDARRAEADAQRGLAEDRLRQVRRAVDEMYTEVAQKWLARQAEMEPVQRDLLRKALRFYEGLAADRATDPGARREEGLLSRRVGEIHEALGEIDRAEPALRRSREIHQALADEFPTEPGYRHDLGHDHMSLARLCSDAGRSTEAEASHLLARDLFARLVEEVPTAVEYRDDLAGVYENLSALLSSTGRSAEGERAIRRAIEIRQDLRDGPAPRHDSRRKLIDARNALGNVLKTAGKAREAEGVFRRALEDVAELLAHGVGVADDENLAGALLHNLANLLLERGEPAEARRLLDRAVVHQRNALSLNPRHPSAREFLRNHYWSLASARVRLGEHAEAARACDELVRLFPDRWLEQGVSASLLDECAALAERDPKLDGTERSVVVSTYARESRARFDKAARECPDDPEKLDGLAWSLITCRYAPIRDPARAVELARRATAKAPGEAIYWRTLGVASYRAGDWGATIEAMGKSMDLGAGGDGQDWFFLAMAHWRRGQKAEARRWFDRAVDWVEKTKPRDDDLRRFHAEAASLLGIDAGPAPEAKAAPPRGDEPKSPR